ncbi:MAG TPA: GNAT family N-acetyltransferase [Chloroflexaceae bacterium]|nr:GNAT family N-acetyltransferase [Chloroflexaceae bacterium]
MGQLILPNHPDLGAVVTLEARDGRSVRVRHMRVDDAALLERMFYRLSSETRYRRFFVPLDSIEEERVHREAARLATIDPTLETALIAVVDEEGREEAVGVARYTCLEERQDACEGSIVLRDDYQGAGIGRQLFDLLVQVALAHGLRHMVLLTHADNGGMIALVQGLGVPYKGRYSSGLYEMDVQLTDAAAPFFPFTSPEEAE